MSERRLAGRRAVDKDYPKTNQGRRSIDLDPETVTALRSHRVRQAERRLALGLRHTHASHLLKAGVNIKIVSRHLDHASVIFTLDKYSHLMRGRS